MLLAGKNHMFNRSLSAMRLFVVLCLLMVGGIALEGCQASRFTEKLVITEGPSMNHGRMSATLGAVRLKDGRVVVVGGSKKEWPFDPLDGGHAIEILDSQQKKWSMTNIKVPYKLAGRAYELPDGRIIVFTSGYILDPNSSNPDPAPKLSARVAKYTPSSGAVSAVLIDLKSGKVVPIYRPKGNKAGNPPVKGKGAALLQRAFDRSIQLKDGRIIRVGGELRYRKPAPIPTCKEKRCYYCIKDNCSYFQDSIAICKEDKDCPDRWFNEQKVVLNQIEIYTPPDNKNPLGSVRTLYMEEARASTGLIELDNGKVLISGGWGPKGAGKNQNYDQTYLLDPDEKDVKKALTQGPRMLTRREDHAEAVLQDGRILMTGGTDQNANTSGTSEIYDPKANRFYYGPPMSLPREDHRVVTVGPLLVFVGGEVKDKADHIRNTAEVYHGEDASHIGHVFLFDKFVEGADGFAGISDFAVVKLDENRLMILGGQQGKQDRDGEYISGGTASRRTLIVKYTP